MENNAADMKAVLEHFQYDRFAVANGMEVIEVRPGYARARMPLESRHLNSVGIGHGGAMFTLADLAFAAACNSAGQVTVAVHMSLACMKAARQGPLLAEAQEISRSRKISTCTVRVTDGEGTLVALFQGTAYIKNEPFPPRGQGPTSQ
jgi:acyl-CoA thioesterase